MGSTIVAADKKEKSDELAAVRLCLTICRASLSVDCLWLCMFWICHLCDDDDCDGLLELNWWLTWLGLSLSYCCYYWTEMDLDYQCNYKKWRSFVVHC